MQIDQRSQRNARVSHRQARACSGIQHPSGHHCDDAWCYLDVNDLAAATSLAILPTQTATIQRMPWVMDLNFLPDMGRMTMQLL